MKNTNNRKKSSSGIIILTVVIIALLSEFLETGSDGTAVIAFACVVGVIVLVGLAKTAAKGRKKESRTSANDVHSHDRITNSQLHESEKEHYRRQLDGFLQAGIIEKSEYRILMQRHGLN